MDVRLRKKNLKQLKLHKFTKVKDNEGGVSEGFAPSFVLINAEIWPATNKRQSELYGLRVNDILNMLYQDETNIEVNDGICVYSQEKPDYRVISKKSYTSHQVFEIERI